MKSNILEKEISYGDGIYRVKEKRDKKTKSNSYRKIVYIFNRNLVESEQQFDVSSVIGNDGSKMIYSKNGFFMDWVYTKTIKNSGEHKKQSGYIFIKEKQSLASLKIEKGYAKEIVVYKSDFAEKIKGHAEMPLYKEISDILSQS